MVQEHDEPPAAAPQASEASIDTVPHSVFSAHKKTRDSKNILHQILSPGSEKPLSGTEKHGGVEKPFCGACKTPGGLKHPWDGGRKQPRGGGSEKTSRGQQNMQPEKKIGENPGESPQNPQETLITTTFGLSAGLPVGHRPLAAGDVQLKGPVKPQRWPQKRSILTLVGEERRRGCSS